MVATLAIAIELQEQFLAQERELDSSEGALVAWENSLMASECVLGRACMERNAECTHVEVVR
jgi:hypothetical protein